MEVVICCNRRVTAHLLIILYVDIFSFLFSVWEQLLTKLDSIDSESLTKVDDIGYQNFAYIFDSPPQTPQLSPPDDSLEATEDNEDGNKQTLLCAVLPSPPRFFWHLSDVAFHHL